MRLPVYYSNLHHTLCCAFLWILLLPRLLHVVETVLTLNHGPIYPGNCVPVRRDLRLTQLPLALCRDQQGTSTSCKPLTLLLQRVRSLWQYAIGLCSLLCRSPPPSLSPQVATFHLALPFNQILLCWLRVRETVDSGPISVC